MTGTFKNIAASVHRRLLNQARAQGKPFNELLHYFVLERFLYRLGQSSHREHFILKGGLMFAVWQAPLTRPTRDVDLLETTYSSSEALAERVRAICATPVVDDGLVFQTDDLTVMPIREREVYDGMRVRLVAHLGNARIPVQLDVGLGDVVVPAPVQLDFPTLLDFPPPNLQGYSRESTIAEKTHALVRLGTVTSRMKDFYDIWQLSRTFGFEGYTLADAVYQTFVRRRTEVPAPLVVLEDAFATAAVVQRQWQAFIRRSRLDDAPVDFVDVVAHLRMFMLPVMAATAEDDVFRQHWRPPGPWQSQP